MNYSEFRQILDAISEKLEKIMEMLENSAISVSECGEAVGFHDNAYFCRIFKKFTGHPPSFYKK